MSDYDFHVAMINLFHGIHLCLLVILCSFVLVYTIPAIKFITPWKYGYYKEFEARKKYLFGDTQIKTEFSWMTIHQSKWHLFKEYL
jgi:hypothetical protein